LPDNNFKIKIMKTHTAVLHIKNKEPKSVASLGGRVHTSMVAHKETFPDPDPTIEVFGKEIERLYTVIKEKDGSKIKNQTIIDQTNVVYAMLKSQLGYTNKVAGGDKSIILLSGFDCNSEPIPHEIPGKALIKRVEDGNTVCSAKIYVEPLAEADRYKVEITTSTDPDSWETILDFGVLNKIEIRNLTRGKETYIRVTGGNRHGWGIASEPVAFIPR
jgi:hypothetical protein